MGAHGESRHPTLGFFKKGSALEFLAKNPFGSLWGSSQQKNVLIAGVQESLVTKFEKKVIIQLLAGYTALKG